MVTLPKMTPNYLLSSRSLYSLRTWKRIKLEAWKRIQVVIPNNNINNFGSCPWFRVNVYILKPLINPKLFSVKFYENGFFSFLFQKSDFVISINTCHFTAQKHLYNTLSFQYLSKKSEKYPWISNLLVNLIIVLNLNRP